MTRPALALAVLLTPVACAGPQATMSELPELAAGLAQGPGGASCVAGTGTGADAAALGLSGLRFSARGQDLGALLSLLPGDLAPVGLVRDEAGVGEVAGPGRCDEIAWGRVVVDAEPEARVRLVALAPAARVALERGLGDLARGHGPEARIAFAAAAAAETTPVPGPLLAVARSYVAEERLDEAVAVYQEVAGRFVTNPLAHAGMGDLLRRRGKRLEAGQAWARAIALWPGHDLLVRRAAADPFVEVHPFVPPPARRRPDGRWALAARGQRVAPETAAAALAEAEAYATCKEAFRTTVALRARVSGDEGPGWRWSPAEESVCTAVWLSAYVRHRDAGRQEEAGLDDLLLVARQGFLDERSFFDVGARAHPLAATLLDAPSRARLLQFVTGHRVMRRQQGGWLF